MNCRWGESIFLWKREAIVSHQWFIELWNSSYIYLLRVCNCISVPAGGVYCFNCIGEAISKKGSRILHDVWDYVCFKIFICSNLRNGTVEDVSSVNPVKLKGQVLATSSAKLGKNLKTKIVLNWWIDKNCNNKTYFCLPP